MRKGIITAILFLGAAAAATAGPHLSGLGVGFGGHIGDVDQGRIGVQYDFALPPYVSLGPELMLGFGDSATTILLGGESRIYLIPRGNYPVQPHALVGAGFGHISIDTRYYDASDSGLYLHFGGGTDFDLKSPITPYFNMGGLVLIADDSLGMFSIEGGLRIYL
jgi:hypothetical protein